MSELVKQPKKKVEKLNVKDTDFILKLFMKSTFTGAEIEQAFEVLKKISDIHRVNIEA